MAGTLMHHVAHVHIYIYTIEKDIGAEARRSTSIAWLPRELGLELEFEPQSRGPSNVKDVCGIA